MINDFGRIIFNNTLWASVLACFLAQALKIFFHFIEKKEIDFTRILGSGGMPSSHSAFVCALSTSIGLAHGFDSSIFAITAVFSIIVMYDAAGVRKAVGEQAKILNVIIKKIENHENNFDKELKELIGHTRLEVLGGAILGIIISLFF